jgi:hypothetical protein
MSCWGITAVFMSGCTVAEVHRFSPDESDKPPRIYISAFHGTKAVNIFWDGNPLPELHQPSGPGSTLSNSGCSALLPAEVDWQVSHAVRIVTDLGVYKTTVSKQSDLKQNRYAVYVWVDAPFEDVFCCLPCCLLMGGSMRAMYSIN